MDNNKIKIGVKYMNPRMMKILSSLLILLLTFAGSILAEGKGGQRLGKVTGTDNIMGSPSRTHFNINSVSTWIYNNGKSDIKPSGNSGFIYPKGSNKAAVFESGFIWGATVSGEKRVGGSTYGTGLLPGAVIGGVAEDPDGSQVRIYRVRRDWNEDGASFSAEIADGEGSAADIKAQYELDWNEWPAEYGAPYEDVDGDGSYDPTKDIPGFIGADQTVWYVANDFDENTCKSLYGSKSMGVEVQATFWGYRQAGAVGNIMFRKYKLINKSSDRFDSMFVSMWSDPDLGDAGDDFSGCDTSLSLMYTYNGTASDNVYGDTPPAIGFDFFQGPIVPSPGDTAIVDGKYKADYKNLEMSAHYFFINGDDVYSDPSLGKYTEGTLQFHNLFRGRISSTGVPFTDPNTGEVTKFTLAGDPVTKEGWIDGQIHSPGDRRQGMVAGPFTMEPGEVQEVVIAELVGGGTPGIDNLKAINILKSNDRVAQAIYDDFFNLPSAPPSPIVNVVEDDAKIVLDWGSAQDRVRKTESSVVPGLDGIGLFRFQGYNVYQLPYRNATMEEAKRIATFDIIDGVKVIKDKKIDAQTGEVVVLPVQFGTDSGIERSIEITNDAFKNAKLRNGTEYYFFVSAYSYNDSTHIPNNLENPLQLIKATPQKTKPGVQNGGEIGEPFVADHTAGLSDGGVTVVVVDPSALTGLTYTITFDTLSANNYYWKVTRGDGVVVLDKQTNQKADVSSPIADGLQFKVQGAPLDFTNFQVVSNANGPLSPPAGAAADYYDYPGLGRTNIENQQATGAEWFVASTDDLDPTYERFLSRVSGYAGGYGEANMGMGALVPNDFEIRFTATGSDVISAWDDSVMVHVPFEIWSVGNAAKNDPSDDFQIFAQMLDFNLDRQFNYSGADHAISSGSNDPYTDALYTIIPADQTPGSAGYNALVSMASSDPVGFIGNFAWAYKYPFSYPGFMRFVFANWNGGDVTTDGPYNALLPEEGTVFQLITSKPNALDDKFVVQTPKTVYSADKVDVEKINVFPNPYYGVNPNEINKYQRYVTFSHLPNKATLRIFNLAGQLVKTVNKDDNSQYQRWDLQNEKGLPVASGVYIVHVDMPEIGKTRVLKVAIIQETQILDRY